MKTYNISVLDDESIKDLFEEAFKKRISDWQNNEIKIEEDNFECEVERLGQTDNIRIKVTIFGLAGGTTRLQFHDKDTKSVIKGGKVINIETKNGSAKFVFDGSSELNTNDYLIYYKLEA